MFEAQVVVLRSLVKDSSLFVRLFNVAGSVSNQYSNLVSIFSNQLSFIIFNFIFLTHRKHGFVEARPLLTSNASLSNTQEPDLNPYSLPQNAHNAQIRAAAIAATQAGFSYGPPVAGGSFFPAGDIGKARVAADMALEVQEAVPVITMSTSDSTHAMNDTSKACFSPA